MDIDSFINLFNKWIEIEESLYIQFVDTLAGEYGWTVLEIQNLSLTEVLNCLKIIKNRKRNEDVLNQINIAKGMAGKISANDYNKPKNDSNANEENELKKLANKLKLKVTVEPKNG